MKIFFRYLRVGVCVWGGGHRKNGLPGIMFWGCGGYFFAF